MDGLCRANLAGVECIRLPRIAESAMFIHDSCPVNRLLRPAAHGAGVRPRWSSSAEDRDQEIERLLALGARRVDIGQTGEESWTFLADPGGNEFCVIRPKETLTR